MNRDQLYLLKPDFQDQGKAYLLSELRRNGRP